MKLKTIIIGAVAAVLGLSGCAKTVDLGPAKVAIDVTSISLAKEGGVQTITLNSTVDWALKDYTDEVKEWVVIDPASGKASKDDQKITVKILENAGTARQASITFFGNVLAKATLSISQAGKPIGTGSGTLEDPYDAAAANAFIATLGADAESTENIYVKGTVLEMKEAFSSYGNCTCYIGSEGSEDRFYVFRALGLGNKKCTDANALKVGDEVIVCGKVTNFKGNTPETVQNAAYFYSINGETGGTTPDLPAAEPKGTGTEADPYNAAAANAYIATLAADAESPEDIYVKGTVLEMVEAFGTYGNCSCYIGDKDYSDRFYVYRAFGLGNQKCTDANALKVGDEVVVCGKVVNYKGNTPETVQSKAYFLSINGETGSSSGAADGEPKGTGTEADPYNATAALNAAKALAADAPTTEFFYIKGYIKGTPSISTSYGNANFNIVDEKGGSTTSFYCFQIMYLAGAKFTAEDQLKEGDEVVVYAQLVNYKGNTPETNGKGTGKLISINGSTEAQTPSYDEGTAKGTGTEADPYNATAALKAAKALAAGESTTVDVYIKGFVKGTPNFSSNYGDMTFNLVDEKAGTTEPLLVYQLLSFGGAKFGSASALKDGDEVVILAKLSNYNGTYETAKGGVAVSVNGATDPGTGETGGGDNPGGSTGSVSIEAGENEVLHALTLEEIQSVLKGETGNAYKTLTLSSAGGDWTGNVMTSSASTPLPYLQFRNSNASFLTSPVYSSNVKRVVIVTTESKFKQSSSKTLRVAAVPVVDPATLPTGKDANKNNITYTDAQMAGAYGSTGVSSQGGKQTLQIDVNAAVKQFSLLSIDGAMYLDAIYVFCEK